MKISEEVREYARKQGMDADADLLQDGMKQKAKEFVESGSELYSSGSNA